MTKMVLVEADALETIQSDLASLHRKLDAVDMTPRSEWMNVKTYAEAIGRSQRTIERRIASGLIECKTVGGERMLFFNPTA